MEKKLTKKEKFEMLKEKCADNDMLFEFVAAEIAALEKKAAKVREKAATKKDEPDVIKDALFAVLPDVLTPIEDIVAMVQGVEDLTKSKASYRLNALEEDGLAVKDYIVIPSGEKGKRARKIVAFKKAAPVEEDTVWHSHD